ncbi:E3 ubiquitin-protein ligase RHA2A [Herrania umbratica]|uniref:E3 ubiquitin-protein ligase RHA2A n=1 Tax=Herrania umbratica TaxID=108875 RepID=A0A6J1BIW9_9ROSI|nr:E3 ubiquitin-protein ligase RHA2A [Herrania umbratica]
MGLQSQLNDVSSDSIPLLLVALVANCLGCLRNLLLDLLQSTGLLPCPDRTPTTIDDVGVLGSGLAGLIVVAEQLNLNKVFSYRYCGGAGGGVSDCMVCLCTLRDGEQVRKLDCCHVFHKDCFDGWLDHLNFNCPLCRSPLKTDQRVEIARRRVSEDLLAWFPLR